jgi:hypothetical protein
VVSVTGRTSLRLSYRIASPERRDVSSPLTQTEKVAATKGKHGTLRIEFRVTDERPESGASDYAGERQLLAERCVKN